MKLEPFVEVRTSACHSGADGECYWSECPQEANNRANYQIICPLYKIAVEPWSSKGADEKPKKKRKK